MPEISTEVVRDYVVVTMNDVVQRFSQKSQVMKVVTFFLLTAVHITDYHWDRHFTSSSTPITHRL
jgi:hypothetical protein